MRRLLRPTLLGSLCLLLGFFVSIGLAAGLAWLRVPINSYSGHVVAVGHPAHPFMLGKEKMVAIWWTFDSEHRLGEQTYAWMGSFSAQEPPDRLTGRPRTFAPIDAFFDHTSLPGPKDRWLNGYGINVARAYGWPFLCLWEGETVDGSNAGLTKWPWNGFSYGGVKIGPSPSLGHFLPALPLWSGLIGDTVVYGAVFLFLGLSIARIRRARLAHLNLCPNCRYDRAGIRPESPCPECGRGGAASVR